jgi:branched-chain amino acid aminotransferase
MTELFYRLNQYKFERIDELFISNDNRAFYYGDGFFETMILKDGELLFQKSHQKRINKSLSTLEIEESPASDLDWLKSQLQEITKNKSTYRIRMTIYRKSEGYYTPNENEAGIHLRIKEIDHNYSVYNNGINISLYHDEQKSTGKFSMIKSIGSSLYVHAGIYAKKMKVDDCLLFNCRDEIMEATSSNLYIINGDSIITPPIESGCIDGIFRRFMLDHSRKLGFTIKEERIIKNDLLHADEIWLSNVVSGLRWVENFKGQKYSNQLYKEFYTTLLNLIH